MLGIYTLKKARWAGGPNNEKDLQDKGTWSVCAHMAQLAFTLYGCESWYFHIRNTWRLYLWHIVTSLSKAHNCNRPFTSGRALNVVIFFKEPWITGEIQVSVQVLMYSYLLVISLPPLCEMHRWAIYLIFFSDDYVDMGMSKTRKWSSEEKAIALRNVINHWPANSQRWEFTGTDTYCTFQPCYHAPNV